MYTIKEAAARTGVGAPLIRAWERRYGVVEPTRTASGYRLYDDATLGILIAMRSLVETGWTASEAARAIKAGEVAIDDVSVERPTGRPVLAEPTHRARLIQRFVAGPEFGATPLVEGDSDLNEVVYFDRRPLGRAWRSP
jgi:DNA-binding transcriptional MerR regulator